MSNNQRPRALTAEEQYNIQRIGDRIVDEICSTWGDDTTGAYVREKYEQGIHAMADVIMCIIYNIWVNKTNGKHPTQIHTEDLRRVLRNAEARLADAANLRGMDKDALSTAVVRAFFGGSEK